MNINVLFIISQAGESTQGEHLCLVCFVFYNNLLYSPQCQTARTPPAHRIHPLVLQERSVLSAQASSLSGSTLKRTHKHTLIVMQFFCVCSFMSEYKS